MPALGLSRGAPPDRAEGLLGAAESGQTLSALLCHERVQPGVDNGGLALDATQSRRFGEQLVIQYECGSHMHKYGDFICISQGN